MWILVESRDGSPTLLSEKFGVTYHSKYGAVQESVHVFIKEGLFYAGGGKKNLDILEIGFGTGLNALLTCHEARKSSLSVRYHAIEQFPIDLETARQLDYCQALAFYNGDCVYLNLHECPWEERVRISPTFSLFKHQQRIEDFLPEWQYDLIYFDAFAPNIQPELWEAPIFQRMYDCLRPQGTLVTYCAKGDFKRTLKSTGFYVETLKGPPGKREMVRAIKK